VLPTSSSQMTRSSSPRASSLRACSVTTCCRPAMVSSAGEREIPCSCTSVTAHVEPRTSTTRPGWGIPGAPAKAGVVAVMPSLLVRELQPVNHGMRADERRGHRARTSAVRQVKLICACSVGRVHAHQFETYARRRWLGQATPPESSPNSSQGLSWMVDLPVRSPRLGPRRGSPTRIDQPKAMALLTNTPKPR